MNMPAGYTLRSYGRMITCEPRMGVYAEALRRAVTPGCTVIDLGASFGAFALLACQFGAGRVIAIEPDPSIELLVPLARANGCADRITIVRDLSTNYTPETKADVIVSDCRGTVPLFQHHISTLADARARLLVPGGTLLPMRDTLRIALVRSSTSRQAIAYPWRKNAYGLDLAAGERFAANSFEKTYLKPSALVSEPQELAVLDYRTITEPNIDVTLDLFADRAGQVDGILVWFDAEIAEGLGYSNAPGQPPLVYGQMLLPFEGSPRLEAGARVTVRVRGTLLEGDYIWNWDWQAHTADGKPKGKAVRQSTFLSQVQSPKAAGAVSNLHIPTLDVAMILDRDCLSLVGEGRSLDAIAQTLQERHPEHLPTYKAALDHAAKCVGRYIK